MPNDNNDRIKGTVAHFNGILGRARDDAGTEYKLHLNQMLPECKDAARRELREGCTIEFTARRTNDLPRAVEIAIIDMPALPSPTGLSIGYWENVRGCRCSACGESSSEHYTWCPVCGAKMYDRETYDILLKTTSKVPAADSIKVKKSSCDPKVWEALCGMFQLDPDAASHLLVSHAIVRT